MEQKTRSKTRNLIRTLVLATPLVGCNSTGGSINGSLEYLASEVGTHRDIKLNYEVENGAGIFGRNIVTNPNGSDSKSLSLTNGYIPLTSGIDAVVSLKDIAGEETDIRYGVQGRLSGENWKDYSLLTWSPENESVEFLNNFTYTSQVDLDGLLIGCLETLTNWGDNGDHKGSVIRPRVGIKKDNFTYGIGANMPLNSEGDIGDVYVGPFVRFGF